MIPLARGMNVVETTSQDSDNRDPYEDMRKIGLNPSLKQQAYEAIHAFITENNGKPVGTKKEIELMEACVYKGGYRFKDNKKKSSQHTSRNPIGFQSLNQENTLTNTP